MAKTELSIELDAETAEGVLEAAKSAGVSVSEWLNDSAERVLATERGLVGDDELGDELETATGDIPAKIEEEFGDFVLESP